MTTLFWLFFLLPESYQAIRGRINACRHIYDQRHCRAHVRACSIQPVSKHLNNLAVFVYLCIYVFMYLYCICELFVNYLVENLCLQHLNDLTPLIDHQLLWSLSTNNHFPWILSSWFLCICIQSKMYLYEKQHVFVLIAKCICMFYPWCRP